MFSFVKISFIAVNCFSSKGECRKTFNLLRYPQIIVHTRDIGFLVYKGPFEYAYLSNYLGLVKKPLERIDNFEEFVDFVLLNDVIIISKPEKMLYLLQLFLKSYLYLRE